VFLASRPQLEGTLALQRGAAVVDIGLPEAVRQANERQLHSQICVADRRRRPPLVHVLLGLVSGLERVQDGIGDGLHAPVAGMGGYALVGEFAF